jgi:hypothetical protein
MIDRKRVGRKSRTKGAQGERDVANELRSVYPDAARGGLLQTQYGTASNACDVEHTPWWIEVKRGQRPNIQGAYDQATDATDGRPVLVVTRKDRSDWLATMTLEQFKHLIGIIKEYQKAIDPEFRVIVAASASPAEDDNPQPSGDEAWHGPPSQDPSKR